MIYLLKIVAAFFIFTDAPVERYQRHLQLCNTLRAEDYKWSLTLAARDSLYSFEAFFQNSSYPAKKENVLMTGKWKQAGDTITLCSSTPTDAEMVFIRQNSRLKFQPAKTLVLKRVFVTLDYLEKNKQ